MSKVWTPRNLVLTKDPTRKNSLWGGNTSHNHVYSIPNIPYDQTTCPNFHYPFEMALSTFIQLIFN